MSDLYVQYGCGLCAPDGWLNFDASPTLRLQRIPGLSMLARRVGPVFPPGARSGDAVRGLPVPNGSCAAVYCSHTLEHLSQEDCHRALASTLSILKPGGVFRFVMPDLRIAAAEYLASSDPQASTKFMQSTLLGQSVRPRGFMNLLRGWIGNSHHLWMWDYPAMEQALQKAGFVKIRKASFGDSGDPRFAAVEEISRWEGALAVHCSRPS